MKKRRFKHYTSLEFVLRFIALFCITLDYIMFVLFYTVMLGIVS